MKAPEWLTLKNVLIIGAIIYGVSITERMISSAKDTRALKLDQQERRIKLRQDINALNIKIQHYENQIENNTVNIANMSDRERDSLRAVLNPR